MPKGRRAKRERITIQRKVTTDGDYGQKKTVRWENVRGLVDVHADYDVTGGTETFRGQQVQAGVEAVFAIRQQPTPLSTEYRVLHGTKPWGIVAFRPSDGPFESNHRDTLIFVRAISE